MSAESELPDDAPAISLPDLSALLEAAQRAAGGRVTWVTGPGGERIGAFVPGSVAVDLLRDANDDHALLRYARWAMRVRLLLRNLEDFLNRRLDEEERAAFLAVREALARELPGSLCER